MCSPGPPYAGHPPHDLVGRHRAAFSRRAGSTCCSRAPAASGRPASAMTARLRRLRDGLPSWRVVPARNEADVIARSIGSLLGPGLRRAGSASCWSTTAAATAPPPSPRPSTGNDASTSLLPEPDCPRDWTGKLWALEQGIRHATPAGDASR